MPQFDLVVRNGRVVQPDGVIDAALCVDGGKVSSLGEAGTARGRVELDATGCLVLPGGVDPHVHISWPYQDYVTSDTYASASVAALFGGTTTLIDFAYPRQGMSPTHYLEARRYQAEGSALMDFGFHTVLVGGNNLLPSPEELLAAGSPSWKLYMTYSRRGIMSDDAALMQTMQSAARVGATICVHAENGTIADSRERALIHQGQRDYSAHYRHKPWWVEAEAVQRATFLAGIAGCRLHVKHLSTRQGVGLIQEARRRGVRVTAETCPHYLILRETDTYGEDGPLFLCSPPLRDDVHREALWEALAVTDGVVCVGADHCDFTREQKLKDADDFRQIPNGLPGIETRFYLLYEEGVRRRGLGLPWLVRVFSTNAARLFGLYPRKGTLQPGADADAVIFDPSSEWVISPDELHMQSDWSPYAGRRVTGRISTVVRRGEVVLSEGEIVAAPGSGVYLHRAPHGAEVRSREASGVAG